MLAREALGSTANVAERVSAAATATSTGLRGQLEGVVGRDHVRTDEGALVTFSTDATPLERGRPDAVVFPATAEEVAGVLRIANERRVPVVPRGSGTNLSAGTVPHRGGIVLVLTRMNKIKEVSDADLVAVCEPGVRTIELAQAAAAKGLLFPPDPGSQTVATDRRERRRELRRPARPEVRRHARLRARPRGRAADGRDHPQRRAARQGRRRLRPAAPVLRQRRHARDDHRADAAAGAAPEASGIGMAYFPDLADAAAPCRGCWPPASSPSRSSSSTRSASTRSRTTRTSASTRLPAPC